MQPDTQRVSLFLTFVFSTPLLVNIEHKTVSSILEEFYAYSQVERVCIAVTVSSSLTVHVVSSIRIPSFFTKKYYFTHGIFTLGDMINDKLNIFMHHIYLHYIIVKG